MFSANISSREESMELLMLAILLVLACCAGLLAVIFLKVRELRRSMSKIANKAENSASNRWLDEQGRLFLAHLLQVQQESLPPLGSFAASPDFLLLVAQHILLTKPDTVVEFGAGASTLIILRCLQINKRGKLVSFDHEPVYARITAERATILGYPADLRVVGLESKEESAGLWYQTDELPAAIDMLIIDGPPHSIHPETREGASSMFQRLAPGGTIFLDDASRPGETAVVRRWREKHSDIEFAFVATARGTVIGRRRDDPA
jgi:predicted O-methyltransferase YrrM